MHTKIENLDELLKVLRGLPTDDQSEYCEAVGLPTSQGECDWAGLPTFGGTEPRDTAGIWSWDSDRVLIGEGLADLAIERRADFYVDHHGTTAA